MTARKSKSIFRMGETSSLSEHDAKSVSLDEKSLALDEKSLPQNGTPQAVDAALERSVTTESAKYPSKKKIIPIMAALYISMFLVALVSDI